MEEEKDKTPNQLVFGQSTPGYVPLLPLGLCPSIPLSLRPFVPLSLTSSLSPSLSPSPLSFTKYPGFI